MGVLPQGAQATGAGARAGTVAVGWWSQETESTYNDVFVAGAQDTAGSGGVVDSIVVACEGDQLVFRNVWNENVTYAEQPLGPVTMRTVGPFEGIEFRVPGCDDPRLDDATELELAGLPLTAAATLTPQGTPTPVTGAGAETFGLCVFAFGEAGLAREVTGALSTGGPFGFDSASLTDFQGGSFAGAGAAGDVDEAGCAPPSRPSLREAATRQDRKDVLRAVLALARR